MMDELFVSWLNFRFVLQEKFVLKNLNENF